ncbi:uncharacterized protein GGS22DRAFT_29516 [Annulohypoxylon maeteangense]|uniref:uncharacterized protein n=1 Tax=Annulohypoxylon maeteangense TaxID=1927788 RepID=UPI002008C175|nr:uncharacterized protein GGS22DRAFT_29516 [Annulohypoxylon maeteangense]KAI0883367.1 hypothetical protein GGS22DRAFT_29516 [Annulohypoxylon maeteangense]
MIHNITLFSLSIFIPIISLHHYHATIEENLKTPDGIGRMNKRDPSNLEACMGGCGGSCRHSINQNMYRYSVSETWGRSTNLCARTTIIEFMYIIFTACLAERA